ncbi:hypothetical protein AVEN_271106-1 [Araneus ventricosus]|uniref:Uncharacterized protein n=1 Tax=Araneus ventricosus TaxID=182803 RepID=A0A4Y2E3L4_ARAVE|nr:hypothetical protein AVEN_271106-1 [Araneus ventricosus]
MLAAVVISHLSLIPILVKFNTLQCIYERDHNVLLLLKYPSSLCPPRFLKAKRTSLWFHPSPNLQSSSTLASIQADLFCAIVSDEEEFNILSVLFKSAVFQKNSTRTYFSFHIISCKPASGKVSLNYLCSVRRIWRWPVLNPHPFSGDGQFCSTP